MIDVGLLASGEFPITSLGGVGVSVSGDLFGAQVSGAAFLATRPDASGTTVVYGGIEAGIDIAGMGLQVMMGLSQDGPLDAFVEVDAPIILDPDSGLALTDLYAGIEFNDALPTLTSAQQLVNNPALTALNQLTLVQWQSQLASQVARQTSGAGFGVLSDPMIIEGGATIYDAYALTDAFELSGSLFFDTTGKIELSGKLTVGTAVSLKGAIYLDLSDVTSGNVEILSYLQFPSQAPIATVYGSIGLSFGNDLTMSPPGSSSPNRGPGSPSTGRTSPEPPAGSTSTTHRSRSSSGRRTTPRGPSSRSSPRMRPAPDRTSRSVSTRRTSSTSPPAAAP